MARVCFGSSMREPGRAWNDGSDVPVARQKKLLSHALHSLLEGELKETASAATPPG